MKTFSELKKKNRSGQTVRMTDAERDFLRIAGRDPSIHS